jgi:hypothetical protein
MSNRTRLPNRRAHEVMSFRHWGQEFHAGLGRSVPDGPIQEVWINAKSGTQAETLARDSAVLLSIALQYNVPIEAMRKSIMRDADGLPSGPVGRLIEIISESEQ